jgi:hypothetical protein
MSTDMMIRNCAIELVRRIELHKANSGPLTDYERGWCLGLGDALNLLQEQATSLGLDATELGLPSQSGVEMAIAAVLDE